VEAIGEFWTLDACTAVFLHGDLSYAGHQALVNIMSKAYDFRSDSFTAVHLPRGCGMPRQKSMNKVESHLKVIAELFNVKPLEDGQATAVDINTLVSRRMQLMMDLCTEKRPLPVSLQVQVAANATGWTKKPSNPHLKNFPALTVKVVNDIDRCRGSSRRECSCQQQQMPAVPLSWRELPW